jgi:H+/Cl- antiporter ClcA
MRSASGAAASTASSPRARDPRARRAAPRVAVTARAVTRADAPRAPSPAPENADQNTLLATAAVVGVASGLAVSAFAATEKAINVVASASCASVGCDGAAAFGALDPGGELGNALGTVAVPALGGLCVSALRALAGGFAGEPERGWMFGKASANAGSASTDDYAGIDLNEFDENEDVRVGVKVLAKTAAAAITLGTGCSLGPEGPSVEIGAAVADRVGAAFPSVAPNRLGLLAAGAAAGFSAGFGAPISGLFFGFESILVPGSKAGGDGDTKAGAVTTEMVILASVLATVASKAVLGALPSVDVPPFEISDFVELPLYLPLGFACGVTAAALRKMNVVFDDFAENFVAVEREKGGLGISRIWHAPIGGFLLGCLALKFPQVTYQGFDNVNALLVQNDAGAGWAAATYTPLVLGEFVLAKLLATAICRGSGLVGGVYAPSLFLGAALGTAFGGALESTYFPPMFVAPPQAYALVAMAGVLGGVCRVPLTAILLLFELTGDYRIILPLMGTVTVATSIVNSVETSAVPFSTSDIETRGVAALASSLVARPRDLMRSDIVIIDEETTIEAASMTLLRVSDSENPPPCAFVVADGVFVGGVTPSSIADAIVQRGFDTRARVAEALIDAKVIEPDVKLRDVDFADDGAFAVVVDSSNQPLGVVETSAALKQMSRERLRSALSGEL